MSNHYYIGVDVGQKADPTAITVVKKAYEWKRHPIYPTSQILGKPELTFQRYELQHLERVPLGTPYRDVARRVKTIQETPQLVGTPNHVIVDATGVGNPVVEMMKEEGVKNVQAITITGGTSVSKPAPREWTVPKRDLASTLQVLLQNGLLKFAEGLPDLQVLRAELQNFKVKINIATGHDSYEAWREGDHDDLVLSLAVACWYAENVPVGFKPFNMHM